MKYQRLGSIVVEGFTSIKSAKVRLRDLNVLVGANGAGIWNKGGVVGLGRGHRETRLTADEPLWSEQAQPVIEAQRGCRVFHFHDTSRSAAVKQQTFASDTLGELSEKNLLGGRPRPERA